MAVPIRLTREGFPGRPAFDTAVSRALLLRAAAGEVPETFRLYRPDPIVAFGRQDAAADGFPEAVLAASERGFASVVRLAGGRAAVFHSGTLAFARTVVDEDPTSRTFARFREMAGLFEGALKRLGVDARVGEVPGEYCPGEYSVNARGVSKLVGIGQRLIAGAAHVGGVVVATDGDAVRDVLVPVYAALGLEWNPSTAGSVHREVGASWERVEAVIIEELDDRFDLYEEPIDADTLALAVTLEADHAPAVNVAG